MLSKNEIKRIVSLRLSKFREEQQRFLVEGPKIVDELIHSQYVIAGLYATADWIGSKTAATALQKGISVEEISSDTLGKISQLKTPNKVVAEVVLPAQTVNIDLQQPILVLDSINDPGNMGTIIRTADWFGIHQIVCSENCVELYNAKVLQSTMGSFLRVQLKYVDLSKWMKLLPQNKSIFGAVMDGEDFYQTELPAAPVFLIGNESKGISSELRPFINKKITIPRLGGAESLNASIATSVILSEFIRRQR